MEPIMILAFIIFTLVWVSIMNVISQTAHEMDGHGCEDGPVDIYAYNDHLTVYRPDDNQNALVPGFFVQRSTNPGQVNRHFMMAGNQSITVLGVLNASQIQDSQGNWDFSRPLRITSRGRVRVWSGEALAVDIPIMSDATSRAVAFTAGVDPAQAYKGITRSACTAAGEWVEIDLIAD